MTPRDLQALLDLRSESEHVEFKEAKTNFHFDKLVDYCVAMANEGGGRIVCGVPPRPTGHPLHHHVRYWMRAGDELVTMSPDQHKRIVNEAQPRFEEQFARTACSEESASLGGFISSQPT